MSGNGFLKRSFIAATLAAAMVPNMFAVALPEKPPASSVGRALTPGEVALAGIFGKVVDSSIVRLHAGPHKGDAGQDVIGQTFDDRTIALYGPPYLSWDYSLDTSALNFGTYIHEMTHIWQERTDDRRTNGFCEDDYRYKLSDGDSLEDFCHEQQAAIVEDYARRYLMPVSAPSNWYASGHGGIDTETNDALLVKVVEAEFPEAREMRLRLHRPVLLPDAKKGTPDIREDDCPCRKAKGKVPNVSVCSIPAVAQR